MREGGFRVAFLHFGNQSLAPLRNLVENATLVVSEEAAMKAKPDFKFGDQVIRVGGGQKRGVVSRVFRSGGVWWLAFEGEPNWRYAPGHFRRVA